MRQTAIATATLVTCTLSGAAVGVIATLGERNGCYTGVVMFANAIISGGAGFLIGCAAGPIAAAISDSCTEQR